MLMYFVGWEFFVGMEEYVKMFKELTFLSFAYSEMFESFGVGVVCGVFLYGFLGMGKIVVVCVMFGVVVRGLRLISFFSRFGADCLGKYSGEVERKFRLLFEEVEKC